MSGPIRVSVVSLGTLLALLGAHGEARADVPALPKNPQIDDPYDVPLAPRPPTLPELTHRDNEISGETTFGVVAPSLLNALEHSSNDTACIVQRLGAEIPIGRRPRFYVGGTYELALGSPPGGGSFRVVPSNLELYGRAVWATRTGLSFGGGLSLLLPTAQLGSNQESLRLAQAAQAIRPWDNAFFLNDSATGGAFVDVRDVVGRFTLQFREGLNGSVNLAHGQQLAAVAQLYAGFRVHPLIGVGLELFETYLLYSAQTDAPTRDVVALEAEDHSRATFTVSPSIRLMTPYVQPALGFATSIGTPLFGSGTVDGFWALRLGATIVWDPWKKGVQRGDAAGTLR